MTRTILAAVAALGAAVALAGCGGGSGSASGTASGTTSGVAGAQTTKAHAAGSASFRAQVLGMEVQLRSAVKAFQKGNVSAAARAGGPLLMHCQNVVQTKLSSQAKTAAQQAAVSHLRTACQDMANAAAKGGSGDLAAAKQLAMQALAEAQQAAQQVR